jgi:endonuclease-3
VTVEDTNDEGGTYTLLLTRDEPGEIEVGALGVHHFPAGAFAYVGSALGTGGFARVDRHRRVAAGDHDTRHWHVDYLTGDEHTRLASVVTTAGVDAECHLAAEIRRRLSALDPQQESDGEAVAEPDRRTERESNSGTEREPEPAPITGFGASDCGCETHLFGHESLDELATVVRGAHDSV